MFILVYQEGPMLKENLREQNIRVCFSNLFEIQYNFFLIICVLYMYI